MTVRGVVNLACRCCGELSTFGANVLPALGNTVFDASQPLTSTPVHWQASFPSLHLWQRSCRTNAAASLGWRSMHHDHHSCHVNDPHDKPRGAARRVLTLEDVEKACWSCEKLVQRGGLVCHGCETVQPPDESLNYFELFSLPETSFDINPQLLERRYKALQWNLHPDTKSLKPPEEREFSTQQAAVVNLAYSILKSPLSRANYLLALRGISAGDNFEGTIEDPELLMAVMEAREEVDSTDDPAVLSGLLSRNRRQQEGIVGALSAAFRGGDTATAAALTNQLQYVAKVEQEIIKKLPQL